MRYGKRESLLLSLLLLSASVAHAGTELLLLSNPDATGKMPSYWTPERFKMAKPMQAGVQAEQPVIQEDASSTKTEPATDARSTLRSQDGRPPARQIRLVPQRLYMPDLVPAADERLNTPQAVGTAGAHYTSTRVFPMFEGDNARFSADRVYPYVTVGRLFFTVNGVPTTCSAGAIQRRIIVTAGSCVHRGSGGQAGFHSNFVFVPAYRDGIAPLMSWNWTAAAVHSTWAGSGGNPRNAANYGMLVMADQRPPTGGAAVALGSVTGWLGWQIRSLTDNHISTVGYACNLDRCEKMQNITSGGALYLSVPSLASYGSDARSGSEGNVWVQNFQQLQAGGGTGSNAAPNRVVGVTGTYLPFPGDIQTASIPDNRWIAVLDALCTRAPGNCF